MPGGPAGSLSPDHPEKSQAQSIATLRGALNRESA